MPLLQPLPTANRGQQGCEESCGVSSSVRRCALPPTGVDRLTLQRTVASFCIECSFGKVAYDR